MPPNLREAGHGLICVGSAFFACHSRTDSHSTRRLRGIVLAPYVSFSMFLLGIGFRRTCPFDQCRTSSSCIDARATHVSLTDFLLFEKADQVDDKPLFIHAPPRKPKRTVKLGDETLLDRSVRITREACFSEITVGFRTFADCDSGLLCAR